METKTTQELNNRLSEIKAEFGKTIFFGMPAADEMMEIEKELIARGELFPSFYSED